MGDNFAPEMGASLQLPHLDDDCKLEPDSQSFPEGLYKDSGRNALKAECDNVVRFLLKGGYRAIVPGREDFGYSAIWLQRMGVLIRHSNMHSSNQDERLTMLAANIRVVFGGGSQASCPLFLSDELLSKADLLSKSKGKRQARNMPG